MAMPTTTIAPARARQYLRSQNLIGSLRELLILGQERAGTPGGVRHAGEFVRRCQCLPFGLPITSEMDWIKSSGRSASLFAEIEGKDPVRSLRALQHLRIAKRANRIAVASLPVFLHRAAGKLVIFGGTFIILGVVDELDKIVDFLIRELRQPLGLRPLQQVLG